MDDGTLGVYVHIPFCERVCPYCDFAVVAARPLASELETAYVDAIERELERRRGAFAGRRLATIYLGGGTPSLLHPESVARIVGAVRKAFAPAAGGGARDAPGDPKAPGALEVTLEVNPSTVERERLPGFRGAGVNRLSLGIQSFDDGVLRRLGRAHRAEEARATLRACGAAGFANLSLDLICGVPGQSVASFERDLGEASASGAPHVSVYHLTIEEGTPYARAVARRILVLPEEDESVRMLEAAEGALEAAGLLRYELSSYARPGFESRHNRRYWERRPVLGLGVGAWSSDPPSAEAPFGLRRANVRAVGVYLERVAAGESPEAQPPEALDAKTARGEAAFLALRTTRGLSAETFAREFGDPPRRFWGEAIDALARAGLLLEAADGSLHLTPRGRLLSDSVFEHFV